MTIEICPVCGGDASGKIYACQKCWEVICVTHIAETGENVGSITDNQIRAYVMKLSRKQKLKAMCETAA
jgi:hypothetical protein